MESNITHIDVGGGKITGLMSSWDVVAPRSQVLEPRSKWIRRLCWIMETMLEEQGMEVSHTPQRHLEICQLGL